MAQVGLARVTSGNQVSPADPHQLPRRCLRGVRRSSSSSVLAGRFWRTCLVAVSKMHLPQYNSILRRLSLAITPPSKKSLNIREKRVSTRCRRGRPHASRPAAPCLDHLVESRSTPVLLFLGAFSCRQSSLGSLPGRLDGGAGEPTLAGAVLMENIQRLMRVDAEMPQQHCLPAGRAARPQCTLAPDCPLWTQRQLPLVAPDFMMTLY